MAMTRYHVPSVKPPQLNPAEKVLVQAWEVYPRLPKLCSNEVTGWGKVEPNFPFSRVNKVYDSFVKSMVHIL